MATPTLSKIHKRVLEAKQASEDDKELKKALDSTKELQINNFWDEAYNTYVQMRHGYSAVLLNLGEKVKAFINSTDSANTPEARARITVLINQLSNDNQRFFNSIDEIFRRHSDKRGSTTGHDEHLLLLQINHDYSQTNDIYVQAVAPIVDQINDIIGVKQAAVEAMNKMQEEMALADPNVVSDAVVVEKPAEG